MRILANTLRVSPTGNVHVLLRCPRGVRRLGGKGALELLIDRRRQGGAQASRSRKVRYKIRAGGKTRVALRLSGSDVGRLGRGRRTRGILISVEEGRLGLKTTIRNPRLKLRGG